MKKKERHKSNENKNTICEPYYIDNFNKNLKSEDAAISIQDSISLSVQNMKHHKILNKIILFTIAFFGCFGSIYGFINMFNLKCYGVAVLFFFAIFFTFFSALFMLPKKFLFVLVPAFLAYEYLLTKNWSAYLAGFQYTVNNIYNKINYTNIEYYRIDSDMSSFDCITTFVIFSSFLLIMLICFFILARPNAVMSFLVTFPLIEIGLYNGFAPSYGYVFMLLSFWISVYVLQNSSYNEYGNKSKANFLRKGNNFFSKPNMKFKVGEISALFLICITLCVLIITSAMINIFNYQRPEKLNTLRSDLKTAASEFSFNDISGSLDRIKTSFNFGSSSNIQNGKIGGGSVKIKNKTDLIATFSDFPYENVYLKNYVGAVYSGDSWDKLPEKSYNSYKDLFDRMKSLGIYAQDFRFLSNFNQNYHKCTVNIEMQSKGYKSNYVPYYALNTYSDFNYINDTTISLNDKQKYSFDFSCQNNAVEQINENVFFSGNDFSNFNALYPQYKEFVYENYLDVPNNDAMKEIEDEYSNLFSKDPEYFSYNTYDTNKYVLNLNDLYPLDILNLIKNKMAQDTSYTLSPGKTPHNRDYINFFLLENHKGYCEHYASAGVMLARMAGIPARYVEGYVVPLSEFNGKNMTSDNTYRIEVKDNLAHAWAEVFVDGYWQPFEFTPGYSEGQTPIEDTSETVSSKTTNENQETKVTNSSQTTKNTTTSESISESSVTTDRNTKKHDNTDTDNISFDSVIKFTVILIVLLIAISIIVIFLKRKYAISKRGNSFKSDNINAAIISTYLYIIKLLEYDGIKNNNMQYLDFASYAEETSQLFNTGEMTSAVEIMLKAGLSTHESKKEELEFVSELAYRLACDIYEKQKKLRKFHMKYISNLR